MIQASSLVAFLAAGTGPRRHAQPLTLDRECAFGRRAVMRGLVHAEDRPRTVGFLSTVGPPNRSFLIFTWLFLGSVRKYSPECAYFRGLITPRMAEGIVHIAHIAQAYLHDILIG
jgi:hypothetical protein